MNRVTVNGIGIDNKTKKNIQDQMETLLKTILTQNQTANVVVTVKAEK
jgi:chorismate mutase